MAHSLEKRIGRIKAEGVEGPARKRDMKVRFPEPPHAGRTVLEVTGLDKAYGSNQVFDGLEFNVGRGDRLLVMGFNGAGKTSLLRVLAGVTEADRGELKLGLNVLIGYYAQEHEGIDPHKSLLDHVRESSIGIDESELRGLLGMFGLTGDKVFQDAGTLSEREDQAGPHPAGGRPPQPAAARRAHQQPRPRFTRGHRPRPRRVAGHGHPRQPRHRLRAERWPPTGCC